MPLIRFKKLGDIFPASDALSNLVFRLSVLREDLAFEALLIHADSIPVADRGDTSCRRAYVFRKHFVTILAARDVFHSEGALINRIITAPENQHERRLGPLLDEARKLLNKHYEDIKNWRHTIGGHIDRDFAQRVLSEFSHVDGFVQVGADGAEYDASEHYWRLPYQSFMLAMLPPGTTEDKDSKDFYIQAAGATFAIFRSLVPAIDHIIRYQIYRMRAWQ